MRLVAFTEWKRCFAASLISLYEIDNRANLVLEMSWLNSSFEALVYD